MADKALIPARIIQDALTDRAAGTGAPPNFGNEVVPHIHTASGRYGIASQSYLNTYDEALRHSETNAERMRGDCGIMESVEARQRAVALLPWHIECDDERDPDKRDLADKMTKILEETTRFTEMRRSIQEAIWYGRSAVAMQYGLENVGGKYASVVKRWEPRHPDKLIFRWDDGQGRVDPRQVGIRVSAAFNSNSMGAYGHKMVGPEGRPKIQATETGLVYWLDRTERETMIIHKHMIEDGPFTDPRSAGRIHGIGIRHRIYWTWYAMIECLQRVVEYLDRAAFGVEIWPYQAGNNAAKQRTEIAANEALAGGRTVILAPLPPGEDAERYMPRLIEPGLGGVNTTIDIIKSYFGHKIKRYILGQTLSSEADATGLGSGVADAHLATLADILAYDARNLEETITEDYLRISQHWNFPDSRNVKLKFRIDTESDNVREKLEALDKAYQMGLRIQADEVYKIVGTSKPELDDEVLSVQGAGQAAAASQGMHPSAIHPAIISPEGFNQTFMNNLASQGANAGRPDLAQQLGTLA